MNRKILNHSFSSFYFDPSKSRAKKIKDEGLVDFYILFNKHANLLENLCAFHVPYTFIYDQVNSPSYSDEESFIMDIILYHKVVDVINNPDSGIEELYLSLLEYFCFGEEIRYTINSCPDGGFGIIALLDERYSNPTITSVVEPDVNEGRFHLE